MPGAHAEKVCTNGETKRLCIPKVWDYDDNDGGDDDYDADDDDVAPQNMLPPKKSAAVILTMVMITMPLAMVMICQGYAKYELPPNTPIQVSIGVDITDIPKVAIVIIFIISISISTKNINQK